MNPPHLNRIPTPDRRTWPETFSVRVGEGGGVVKKRGLEISVDQCNVVPYLALQSNPEPSSFP